MIKLIKYHLPPIVKRVLAPQNDLACQKLLGQITKVLGLRRPPPHCWEKLVFFVTGPLIDGITTMKYEMIELQVVLKGNCQTAKQISVEAHYMTLRSALFKSYFSQG